jgi:hypothetical protein
MILENILYNVFTKSKKNDEIKENYENSSYLWTIIYAVIAVFGFYMWYAFHFLVKNPDKNYLTILYPTLMNSFYIIFNFITDYTRSAEILTNFGSGNWNSPVGYKV